MTWLLLLLIICLGGGVYFLYRENRKSKIILQEMTEKAYRSSSKIQELEKQVDKDFNTIHDLNNTKSSLNNQIQSLDQKISILKKYEKILDIEKHIQNELIECRQRISLEEENLTNYKKKCHDEIILAKETWEKQKAAEIESYKVYKTNILEEAESFKNQIDNKIKSVEKYLEAYKIQIQEKIEEEAQVQLEEYYSLAKENINLNKINKALQNKIQGYSDDYLLPNQAILNDLIDGYEHLDAARRLKNIKLEIKNAVKEGMVAECDYVEDIRKSTAIAFITNAFNSKADVHVSRLRHDNVGKLIEALKDDYLLLNNYGQAFRNARINESYLALRIQELKWASLVMEFKEREREEQREIREQIREEEKARKEYERALKEAEKEEEAIRKAYEKAQKEFNLASNDQKEKYDQKMKELMLRLKEAEDKNQRTLSMAQQTRAGHVYVISNIGSFGENVLKLGMTRRLDPMDRVKELGDASVPFTFDVHAMIYSEDAPALEKKLHHRFNHERVNKVNYKKEFFKTSLTDVKNYLDELGLQAKFTLKAEATQYRESLKIELMPDDEQRKLEDAIEKIELSKVDYEMIEAE